MALLGRTSAASNPPSPPAPPCTVEMLKQRPAGDKSWPIRCRGTTLGTADHELDLSGAHLSYGDFHDVRFIGAGTIKLDGAGLRSTNMSGAKLIADGGWGNSLVDLTGADLTNASLSGVELTALTTGYYGSSTIDLTNATLDQVDLGGATLTANSGSVGTIDFTDATQVDLSGTTLTADSIVGLAPSPPPSLPPSPPSPKTK